MSLGQYINSIKKIDWLLLAPVLLLIVFGLATLYTTNLNVENPDWTTLNKQLLFFGIGFIILLVVAFSDYRRIASYSAAIYIISLLLLVAVLIWGRTIRGTTGWFSFLGFSFQPVELAKLALVLTVSSFYSKRRGREKDASTVVTLGAITLLPVALTMLQPDFGSAAMLLAIGLSFFILLSLKPKQILFIILIILVLAMVMWNYVLVDYQKSRILTFVDPMRDPLGRGYNVRQSIIAIGSGKLWGRGLGLGTQSQLRFLPETATDFIFATIAESLGLFGATILIALFAWLFIRLLKLIKNARDNLSSYLIFGFGVALFVQTIINIGMNMGILPVTGLPLPFVSSGGSFLVVSLVAIGMMESIAMRQKIS
ncbi:MAG TPA: rod shape-determining protein RodA [Patescibacteria group bacterium]|nr:rod shape-determining protein RodA [Patescibacteria group bacterium]